MKDTVTIYICKCGAEFDSSHSTTEHMIRCGHHGYDRKELTDDEYQNWLAVRNA